MNSQALLPASQFQDGTSPSDEALTLTYLVFTGAKSSTCSFVAAVSSVTC